MAPSNHQDGNLQSSRYNFSFTARGGLLLYNAGSGSVLRLAGHDAEELVKELTAAPHPVSPAAWPPELCEQLLTCGFVVPEGTNELEVIRERYWRARRDTPMTLTITTTMDCNLGCYYCYEERSGAQLAEGDIAAIVQHAERRLLASRRRTLHVDWYGGEPLLNLPMLELGSEALQAMCARLGVTYGASIVSNGTAWPAEIGAFVEQHRLRQVQISFDGLAANHVRRRRYRRGRAPIPGDSSFERAAAVVDSLLDHVRVDVRLNLDRKNQGDLLPFIAFMKDRGWFHRRFPAVFQPARISAFSDRSVFMRAHEIPGPAFEFLREQARRQIDGEIAVEESEVPNGYPYPRNSVCAALADDSVVVGAEGGLYRCGLQVGEQHRQVGSLGRMPKGRLPIVDSSVGTNDQGWWSAFDPTTLPTCSRCSFLPICWGGCPKRHLDGDTHAIQEQGAYWRRNLARLVTAGAGDHLEAPVDLGTSAQFRD